jgi:uncharacterized spore protein YtfJ
MDENKNGLFTVPVKGHQEAMALLGKLADVAEPRSVFGDPVTVEGQTVITASEVQVGLGYGYGMGGSPQSTPVEEDEEQDEAISQPTGFGGGGGGGGSSTGRPVAVIHVNADGVQVEPIIDITKVSLALFTMIGTIFAIGAKIRKAYRES